MATNFPTSLDALTNPSSSNPLDNPSHSGQHANINDAVEAIQAKVGVNSSAVTTSLDYKVTTSKTVTDAIDITGATSNLVLKYNGTKFIPTAETSSSGASYVVFDDVGQPNTPDKWVAVSEIRTVTWTGASWSVGAVIDRVGPSGPGYTLIGTARQPFERYKVVPYNQVVSHNVCATADALTSFGNTTTTATGTQSAVAAAQNSPNADKFTSTATASADAGFRQVSPITCIGTGTDWAVSGFDVRYTVRFNDASYNNTGASTGSRIAVGLSDSGTIATVLASDSLANSFVGFVRRHVNGGATDTNWQLLCRATSGPTTIDTGVAFAVAKWYTLRLWMAPGATKVGWQIINHTDGTDTGASGRFALGTSGNTTFTATGTSVTAAATYTGVTQTATSGVGTGAVFTIQKTGAGTAYSGFTTVTVTSGGSNYAIGDTITLPGASLGGATSANNLTLTVVNGPGSWTPGSNLPAASTMLGMFAGLLTVDATARTIDVNHASLTT